MIDERIAYYWLATCGLSIKKQNELLAIYGDPCTLYDNLNDKNLSKYAGKSYAQMKRFASIDYLTSKLKEIGKQDIKVLVRCMPQYPQQLKQSEVGAPLVLYYKGNINLLSNRLIAMVGTRHSDEYGRECSKFLASKLADEFVIVTGHATGIDTYSAKYALNNGGKVVIVAACGISTLKLPDFIRSADSESVLIISEYEPSMIATPYTFPARNRLIAGLSYGVIVVQAPKKSGAMITATCASNQGRNVYAVPGSILSNKCAGTNELIVSGATPILDAKIVYDEFKLQYQTEKTAPISLDENEKEVYDFLKTGYKHIDEIVENVSLPADELFALLVTMELGGKIKKKTANYYEL